MTTLAQRRTSYVPWLFVGGFGITIAVNAVMIWFAISSFSGLYSTNPREQGLHYNDVLAQQKARDALSWKVDIAWRPSSSRLEIDLRDTTGQPLSGAQVRVSLVRPVEKRAPIPVVMQAVDSGRFAAHVDLPERGNWDIDIVVDCVGQHYAATRRMFLR
jgi:nitrogen fixation protein FixH